MEINGHVRIYQKESDKKDILAKGYAQVCIQDSFPQEIGLIVRTLDAVADIVNGGKKIVKIEAYHLGGGHNSWKIIFE